MIKMIIDQVEQSKGQNQMLLNREMDLVQNDTTNFKVMETYKDKLLNTTQNFLLNILL